MSTQSDPNALLIGNSFPMSLIHAKVMIEPQPLETLKTALTGRRICSFWGHPNTLAAANRITGANLTPATERPALKVTPNGRPQLENRVFTECWVLTPQYTAPLRPAVGEEVEPADIMGWRALQLSWTPTEITA